MYRALLIISLPLTSLCAYTHPRAIVFDFGGVIAKTDKTEIIRYVEESFSLSSTCATELLTQWHTARMGGADEEQFFKNWAVEHQKTLPAHWFESFQEVWKRAIQPIPGMIPLVKDLKEQGYIVAMLSNCPKMHAKIISELGYYDFFSPLILSCQVHCAKPDPKIFALLLQRLACLPPEDIVFIDDDINNVEAAKKCGIDSLFFHSTKELQSELLQRGVKVGSQVVAIEGMPGAGKTSSLLQLINELEGSVVILSELSSANPDPNKPWKNLSIQEKTELFHRLWGERMQMLQALDPSHLLFLLDRTYISNLAFAYAMDALKGSNEYPMQKASILKDFDPSKDFARIIVFDVSPENGLQRRKDDHDPVPWPWSDLKFLEGMRQFYQRELPSLCPHNVSVIQTEDLSPKETFDRLEKLLLPLVRQNKVKKSLFSKAIEEKLLRFGREENLGDIHSQLVNIFGFPTLYYQKQSIQLDKDGTPLYFNNDRLMQICKEQEEK